MGRDEQIEAGAAALAASEGLEVWDDCGHQYQESCREWAAAVLDAITPPEGVDTAAVRAWMDGSGDDLDPHEVAAALCDELDRLRDGLVQVGTVAGFGRVAAMPTVVWPDEGEPVYVYRPPEGPA